MTRRERIAAIRADLAARLESGELATIAATCEAYQHPWRWVTIGSLEGHVRSLLDRAVHVERADRAWRGTDHWRQTAEWVVRELEHVAAWVGRWSGSALERS